MKNIFLYTRRNSVYFFVVYLSLPSILVWTPLKALKGMKDLINLYSTFLIDFALQNHSIARTHKYFLERRKILYQRNDFPSTTITGVNWMWSIRQLMLDIFWTQPNSWGVFTSARSQLNCHCVRHKWSNSIRIKMHFSTDWSINRTSAKRNLHFPSQFVRPHFLHINHTFKVYVIT